MKKYLLLLGAAFLLKKGVNTTLSTKQAYTDITVKPRNIKNISLSTRRIKFDTDLELQNNSEKTIRINQSLLSYIARVDFYLDNQYIGYATPEQQDIEITPYGYYIMRNITVEVPTNTAIELLQYNSLNLEKVTVRTHINVAGQTIVI